MLISNCCSCPDSSMSIDGPEYSDLGICPDCKEHCEFVEEDMSQDRVELEVNSEAWYKEQDQDRKWIEEQEAISRQHAIDELERLGIDWKMDKHFQNALDMLGSKK